MFLISLLAIVLMISSFPPAFSDASQSKFLSLEALRKHLGISDKEVPLNLWILRDPFSPKRNFILETLSESGVNFYEINADKLKVNRAQNLKVKVPFPHYLLNLGHRNFLLISSKRGNLELFIFKLGEENFRSHTLSSKRSFWFLCPSIPPWYIPSENLVVIPLCESSRRVAQRYSVSLWFLYLRDLSLEKFGVLEERNRFLPLRNQRWISPKISLAPINYLNPRLQLTGFLLKGKWLLFFSGLFDGNTLKGRILLRLDSESLKLVKVLDLSHREAFISLRYRYSAREQLWRCELAYGEESCQEVGSYPGEVIGANGGKALTIDYTGPEEVVLNLYEKERLIKSWKLSGQDAKNLQEAVYRTFYKYSLGNSLGAPSLSFLKVSGDRALLVTPRGILHLSE